VNGALRNGSAAASHPQTPRRHAHQNPPARRLRRQRQRARLLVLAVVFAALSLWARGQFHVHSRLAARKNQKSDNPRDVPLPPAEAADGDETKKKSKGARTVGVAVTVTGCSDVFADGAAVLQYSVMMMQKRQQQQRKKLRSAPSRYQYYYYVIYHPSARKCAEPLKDLNFTLLERESPVLPEDIRGADLRAAIAKSGTSLALA
jgi:hypothetical protein